MYVLILNFLHRIVFKSNTRRTFLLQLFVWFLRIFSRLEFLSDKSRLGSGKKRNIHFQTGPSDEETISSAGFLNSDLIVKIAPGLPNTSSEYFCFIFNHLSRVILIIVFVMGLFENWCPLTYLSWNVSKEKTILTFLLAMAFNFKTPNSVSGNQYKSMLD